MDPDARSTVPRFMREDAPAAPRGRWHQLRRASAGARLVYGLLAVVAVSLVVGAVDLGLAVQARDAERARLEQAAVDALPAGLRVHARGVRSTGASAGYASAFSPLPPARAVAGVRATGPAGWTPIEGLGPDDELRASRAWLNGDRDEILSVDAVSCASARAPAGCPDGGSVVRTEVAPGGPES